MTYGSVPEEFQSRISDDGTTAWLSYRNLSALPNWLTSLPLKKLNLSGNELTIEPNYLGLLRYSLKELDLSNTKLTSVPEWLAELAALEALDLSDNQLTAEPDSLGNLTTTLKVLWLNNNQLTSVPEWLGDLAALEVLELSHNQLTSVPKSLGNLTALKTLDLGHNKLVSLPRQLYYRVANGLQMTLASNPLARSDEPVWTGKLLDRTWMRLRSLFMPSVSLASVLAAANTSNFAEAVLQLYTWERERLLTLAKGTAGAAITVLAGLIASAIEGKVATSSTVLFLAAALVAALLFWAGFLLIGLRRLAEEYTTVLDLKGVKRLWLRRKLPFRLLFGYLQYLRVPWEH